MNPLDSVWLMMESPDTPMHVGVLAIFCKPRSAGDSYQSDMAARMRGAAAVAPWNQRVSRGLSRRLVEDDEFDIDYHFRRSALPEPGGERELGQMVSRLHSNTLDRDRPLWEFHLIEGLERNRFAFYIKVHHAMIEAVNGVPAVLATLADSSRTRNMQPLWAQPLSASGSEGDITEDFTRSGLSSSSIASLGRAAVGMPRTSR